jgi:GntR family transcriptional regulator/MocR family aminotransferase
VDDLREPVALGGPELLLSIGRDGGAPLHEQLESSLRGQIRTGRLTPGARVPSSRALAAALGLSRGVVLEAYSQLAAEGYLIASQGAPTRVAEMPAVERPPLPAESLDSRHRIEFDPALPDLAAFPLREWSRSLRRALRTAPFTALGTVDPRGRPELRNELMSYLGRVRAAAPEPEHTIACAGFTAGFAALCRTLTARGVERIAVEDPGWVRHRLVAEAAGLEVVAVAVDDQGLDVSALEETECEVVIVTPAHQFPTGVVLSAERRADLLEWAEERDALIVEDDHDSELRYDRVAVGALQGLAPERVCHIGSASSRLAPAVRMGWVLAPSWLSGALTYEQGLSGGGPPVIEQLALADFLARGELDRHLRRMRLRYRARRAAALAALAQHLPGARITGIAAGLYVPVLLPDGTAEESVLSAAGRLGVGVEGLATHRAGAGGEPGLVLGFAGVSEEAIEEGVRLLGEGLRDAVA